MHHGRFLGERWPEYRQDIEEEVAAGNPPHHWDPYRPWAAVITRAAEDHRYWEKYVEKPIDRSGDLRGAAEKAAMVHRDFLPPSALDGFDEMMRTVTDSAPGP